MSGRASPIFTNPPSLEDITILAEEALKSLPRELSRAVQDVGVRVEDFPDEETEREMELESPFDLLGLYRGVDLLRRSVGDVRGEPDVILLYRRPILDYWCETEEDLPHIVRHVLIHEIGHHFGFSDDDMERLEREAD
jgi:predicted Zn-dependent protease with MMP-like domain